MSRKEGDNLKIVNININQQAIDKVARSIKEFN